MLLDSRTYFFSSVKVEAKKLYLLHLFFYDKGVTGLARRLLDFYIRQKNCQPFPYYMHSIKQVETQ